MKWSSRALHAKIIDFFHFAIYETLGQALDDSEKFFEKYAKISEEFRSEINRSVVNLLQTDYLL